MKQNKLKTKLLKWYNSSHLKKFIDFSIKLWKINGYFYLPSSLAFYFIIYLCYRNNLFTELFRSVMHQRAWQR